jgi:hypothetical protein
MRRLSAWYRRLFGWPCDRCGGRGCYTGYAPTASLATFRHAGPQSCYHCGGVGRVYR